MMPARITLAATLAALFIATAAQAADPAPAHKAKAKPAKPAAAAPKDPNRFDHGRFQQVAILKPEGTPTSFVLFFSGDGGWNAGVVDMAKALVAKGAFVAGINTPQYLSELEKEGGQCSFPDGDLENLSHTVQAYYHLPTYLEPILVGYSSGATLAYATLVQAPKDTFAGALTLGFCPDLNLHKPICEGSGIKFEKRKDGAGVNYLPAKQLADPWIVLNGSNDQVCQLSPNKAFVQSVPNSEFVELPKVGHGFSVPANWMPQFEAAFDKLSAKKAARTVPAPPASLSGLPIVEVPAKDGAPASDVFALLISGDGGWAGIDEDVAAALSAKGIPVIGIDSLRYFWTPRTPDGLANDLDKVLRYYLANLKKKRALLIGYSQGADVLPFALNRLPAETRSQLAVAAVMGLSEDALFEFHLASWVGAQDKGLPTMPEIKRLEAIHNGPPLLCLYGEEDDEALCPKLDPKQVQVVKMKGGHHFSGAYDKLAEAILAAIPAAK